jgi:anti-sigma B factor antagonist
MSAPADQLPPKVERSGNLTIITLQGGKHRDVENMIARELAAHADGLEGGHLLLDFSNVEYLGSHELGTLVALHKRMKASGGRLTLFNLSANVYEVFTITRLQTLMGICR